MKITMPVADPTLAELKTILGDIEVNQEKRSYLGASGIGDPCLRKSWYYYHKPDLRKPLSPMGHLAVNCGHRAEDTMAAYLRLIPNIELITSVDGNGGQIGFTDFNGKFKGHADGFIRGLRQAPETPHVWEHKDTNQRKFNEFQKIKNEVGEKSALRKWNIIYYGQAQLYMHYFGMKRHYTTITLSGVRDFDSCRTEYNKGYAEELRNRAKMVIEGGFLPERLSNKPDYYLCRFCDFKEECHGTT